MNNEIKTFTDITDLSDAALDAFLDVKTGADFVDAEKLTVAERYAVAAALGFENNSHLRAWAEPYAAPTGRRGVYLGPDIEAMIFEEQEDEGNNVG